MSLMWILRFTNEILSALPKSVGNPPTRKDKLEMNTYIYNADIYCEPCGNKIKRNLDAEGLAPLHLADEFYWDSGDYPKGPYDASESDTPDHCGSCGVFLENPLTSDGYDYIMENQNSEWDEFYVIER